MRDNAMCNGIFQDNFRYFFRFGNICSSFTGQTCILCNIFPIERVPSGPFERWIFPMIRNQKDCGHTFN